MNKYELLYIVEPDVDEERRNKILERIKGVVEQNGQIENIDEWGNRKLAYEINEKTEGFYALVTFESDKDTPKELNRVLKITDNVMRSMITRVDN